MDKFKSLRYTRIRGVNELKYNKQYFYDIEVEETHNYMHASGIFTHNCHIPKTFSGALRPHKYHGGRVDDNTVNKLYKEYKKRLTERVEFLE